MSGSSPHLDASEQAYQVILLRKDEHILTPGELNFEEARRKASYLSQYGQVSILDVRELRGVPIEESLKVPSPLT